MDIVANLEVKQVNDKFVKQASGSSMPPASERGLIWINIFVVRAISWKYEWSDLSVLQLFEQYQPVNDRLLMQILKRLVSGLYVSMQCFLRKKVGFHFKKKWWLNIAIVKDSSSTNSGSRGFPR